MTDGRDGALPGWDEIFLHQLQVGPVRRRMDLEFGSYTQGRTELTAERTAQDMVLELRSAVLGAQVLSETQTFSVEYPASWWQHLKADHAPAWFTRRWPVKMTKRVGQVNFKRYDTYPLANVPLPPNEFGYPVRVEMFRLLGGDASGFRAGPPGPPRFTYANRIELASGLFNEAFPKLMAATRTNSDGPHPRVAVEIFLDALERFGVNVNQLIDETALGDPRPEKEAPC